MKSWTVKLEKDPDSDDILMPIPPELMEELGWNLETVLEFVINEDKTVTIREYIEK